MITLIVAATSKNGIGWGGRMPWDIPKDLAYFGRVTTNAPVAQMNVVLMGRKTWESIPHKFRPLKGRINVVLSRNKDYELFPEGTVPPSTDLAHLCPDLKTALQTFGSQNGVHHVFVTGGSSIYQEALALGRQQADRILMTRIHRPEFECDVFFPDVLRDAEWKRASHSDLCEWVGFGVPAGIQTEKGTDFEYQMWTRTPK